MRVFQLSLMELVNTYVAHHTLPLGYEEVTCLFDSIHKGYPIGQLVFQEKEIIDGRKRIQALSEYLLDPYDSNNFRIDYYFSRGEFLVVDKTTELSNRQMRVCDLMDTHNFLPGIHQLTEVNKEKANSLANKFHNYRVNCVELDGLTNSQIALLRLRLHGKNS